jgi:hypothetical protein
VELVRVKLPELSVAVIPETFGDGRLMVTG